MVGRTPGNIVAIRPMKDGVIADFKGDRAHAQLLHPEGPRPQDAGAPRIIIGVPSEITQVEKRAVIDSAYHAKAANYLVEQAMVAGDRRGAAHHRAVGLHGGGYRRRAPPMSP